MQALLVLVAGAGEAGEGLGLLARLLGRARAPGGDLDRAADDRTDGDEHDERDDLVGVRDVQGVARRDEVVVDEQGRDDGGRQRHEETPDERDDDHRQQVEQDLSLERQRVARGDQQQREQREPADGYRERGEPAAAAEARPRGPGRRNRLVEEVLCADVLDAGADAHGRTSCLRTHGTLVTVTDGSNRSRPFSRNAVWLCRRFCHQCSTTYSGMTMEIMSPGCSLRRCWM